MRPLMRSLCGVTALLALGACKDAGTASVTVELAATCTPDATEVDVYLLRGVTCDTCTCGACFARCDDAGCVRGCPDGLCSIADLEAGAIALVPDDPGGYAMVIDYYETQPGGLPVLVASACADVVFGEDETGDRDITASGDCCD